MRYIRLKRCQEAKMKFVTERTFAAIRAAPVVSLKILTKHEPAITLTIIEAIVSIVGFRQLEG
jgi:hypothetical protein